MFIINALNLGKAKITAQEQRIINASFTDVAKAKYNRLMINTQNHIGYDYLLKKNLVAVPIFGLDYTTANDSTYTENGSIDNLTVISKPSQKLSASAGLTLHALGETMLNHYVALEANGKIKYDIINKTSSTTFHGTDNLHNAIPGLSRKSSTKNMANKISYNLGAAIKMKSNNIETSISHEVTLSKKYCSHQSILKIKINF